MKPWGRLKAVGRRIVAVARGMESMRCIICWSSAISFFNASKSAEEGFPVGLAWDSSRVYLCTSVLSTRAFSSSIGAPRFRRRFAVKDRVSMGSVRMNVGSSQMNSQSSSSSFLEAMESL